MKPFLLLGLVVSTVSAHAASITGGASTDLTSPGPIGSTTPGSGSFTSLSATGNSQLGDALTDTVTIGVSGILVNEAVNTLAMRNGVNSQAIRIYNTYTNSSNYERLLIGIVSNTFTIEGQNAGTGSARDFQLGTLGAGTFYFYTSNTNRWKIDGSSGHLLAITDNTYDIGATGATRPRDVFLGGKLVVGTTVRLKGYTVATLPAGTQGDYAFVTDALAPAFLVAIASGGSAKAVVFYDGTNWVAE